MSGPFRHDEAGRTLLFGRGVLADGLELLGDGLTLLSTPRALAAAPEVEELAERVVLVPAGKVDAVAGDLLAAGEDLGPDGMPLVALGGGRVIDVAKALAAAAGVDGPRRAVAAIPTTLSGAEMTGSHRHARGVPADAPRVRPSLVVNDPALSASASVEQLAASSGNALGHVLIALSSRHTTPFASAVARESAQRFAAAWAGLGASAPAPADASVPADAPASADAAAPDRDEVALGALLAGWAVDHSGLGFHHVLAQTAVRGAGVGHAQANVALLPASVEAVRRRRPELLAGLDAQLALPFADLAILLRTQTGGEGLSALAADEDLLDQLVDTAAKRTGELSRIPPAPDAAELRALYLEAARAGA
ncbi:iron-containing alcohol dehydrogenase [Conexibacter sp. JD483]|uniref:iron-containing alcohol dehydrogenase n=1 Tax=unclassified Conexibacter TaxID=2627773 RepID=UPI00272765C4|nr:MULTISPECIES: iron-containing alcohol dehydrogenase [unclassified Conexibacter]MDO8185249.1 iron-containing alcohol dehydrogenase [Conexibacter sp. CPCC 205706]MDO8198295.1 iron-containing alcohol dehydrogenase [Conexibacter sp. CPCC 205762]MDR9367744.1 iron-containing alcohol dehydrogenase [Conexibacter sp. JD483]